MSKHARVQARAHVRGELAAKWWLCSGAHPWFRAFSLPFADLVF